MVLVLRQPGEVDTAHAAGYAARCELQVVDVDPRAGGTGRADLDRAAAAPTHISGHREAHPLVVLLGNRHGPRRPGTAAGQPQRGRVEATTGADPGAEGPPSGGQAIGALARRDVVRPA